jgi:hypothetical protein
VQLLLLKPDGSGKVDEKPRQKTIASPDGQPIVLAPVNDLLGLTIAEGVEDGLSAFEGTGRGAWASGGASFLPKLAPTVPNYVECVVLFPHKDETGQGQRATRELAILLKKRGVEVLIEGEL